MTPKRLFAFFVIVPGLAQLLQASEHVCCKSPDGKFALRETLTELNPVHGDTAITESVIVCERFGFAQKVLKPASAASDAASRSKPPVALMQSGLGKSSSARG
jgi:hypothetical protein